MLLRFVSVENMPNHTLRSGKHAADKRSIDGLGERIGALRVKQGLSQQVLATRAGMSIPRLRDAERFSAATTETLTLLARVLGVSVDVLSGRKEMP